jgi:hypothetical protein
MRGLIGYLVGGFAVVFAMDYAAPPGGAGLESASHAAALTLPRTNVVNRAAKGDKSALASSIAGLDTEYARNRSGRVLFQTDPVANATVAAKGAMRPEGIMRETRNMRETRSAIEKAPGATDMTPVSQSSPPARKIPTQKIPEGCDPAFSPLAASARANNFTARCLAAIEPATRIASAN